MLGRMQYAPTHTDQKINSLLSIESSARYVLGHMQYAPTLTDQKFDSTLSIESKTRYVFGRMQYAPTLTDEWIPEDRLVIPFPQRKRSGGSIGNPILSAITY